MYSTVVNKYVQETMDKVLIQVPVERIDEGQLTQDIRTMFYSFEAELSKDSCDRATLMNFCPSCGKDLREYRSKS